MKIAFNTANLVARATDYKFSLSEWGRQDQLTRQRTDEREFAAICSEIAGTGFTAVEIWIAHLDPAQLTQARATTYRKILADHGLTAIGIAGALNNAGRHVCELMQIDICNGGMWNDDRAEVQHNLETSPYFFNFENHPEKSAAEIRERITGMGPKAGIALDTGWLGTQGVDAPTAVRELGSLIRHVHLKDVRQHGGHDTCPLGEGVVNIAATVAALKAIGYSGWYSWEDEPEDRNPFDIAGEMLQYIGKLVKPR
jgi:sugar phosphate isomerase/epimerase